MAARIPVRVVAMDPVSHAGVVGALRGRPEVEVVGRDGGGPGLVVVIVADCVDGQTIRLIRASVTRWPRPRVVVIVTALDTRGARSATEAGARALVRRADSTADRLAATVCAASLGTRTRPDRTRPERMPAGLPEPAGVPAGVSGGVARGLSDVGLAGWGGLTERERRVLSLLAEGLGTADVARRLAYSERTIKNVVHGVTTRLRLRNRAHAVAYAVREGLI